MAYSMEISRQNKALFVFLLDQSFSMDDPLANSTNRKIDALTAAINAWLQNLSIACAKAEGFKDFFDICIIGYGTDEDQNPIIEPALIGPLAGRDIVTISEIAENPARIDIVTAFMQDEETGELLEMPQQMPIWIDPVIRGATPICSAIVKVCEIVDNWIAQHPNSFPPIIINITDGESSEGDPIPYADTLRQRETKDGNVLFFNCCVSSTAADPFLFKGNGELLPDEFAKSLFKMSSVLPESIVDKARAAGQELEPNARGMAYNADMVALIKFLDLGTRAATLR
jgi:uncharacterized protein YegL